MKYKSVLAALFLIILSANGEASTVEVAQWWPWSFIETELKNSTLDFSSEPRDVTLEWQDWHPLIKEASLETRGHWTRFQVQRLGLVATTEALSLRLRVPRLIVNQTIVKEINGNRFEILVQASCDPFEIQVPSASLSLKAAYQRQGKMWSPQVTELKLALAPGWSVSPMSCQGPQGFEQVITGLLQNSLNNPDSIAGILQNLITTTLNKKWSQIWAQITDVGFQNLKVTSMEDPGDQGFFMRAQIQSGNDTTPIALSQDLHPSKNSNRPQFLISDEGFRALVKEKAMNFSVLKYNLQGLQAFKSLMHSRFLQFFVWPDLMHFSKSSPLLISSSPSENMDVQPLGKGQWRMQSQTRGIIEAQRKSTVQTYLHWALSGSYNMSTEIKDSLLKLTVNQSKINISYQFDADYVKQYKPNQRISNWVFKKAEPSLNGRSFEFQMPILDLKTRILKLNNWTEAEGLIWMDWN